MKKTAAQHVVHKHRTHHKPKAPAGHSASGGAGAKGAASTKHAHHRKHHPKRKVKRGLALGDGVACCSAEALAASLRLAGAVVSDDDVLALHWAAGGTVDAGVSILAALEAAQEFGLGGMRPLYGPVVIGSREVNSAQCSSQVGCPGQLRSESQPMYHASHTAGCGHCGDMGAAQDAIFPMVPAGLILGLELPGPHAVLAEPGRWWSWGERYDPAAFPGAIIEEAWAVSWL